jgi:hypothetical protein
MKNKMIEIRKKASRLNRNPKNKSTDYPGLNLIQEDGNTFVFYFNRPVAIFPTEDLFSRNVAIINLYLNLKITQKDLSIVFGLSEIRVQQLFKEYRERGLAGLSGHDAGDFFEKKRAADAA